MPPRPKRSGRVPRPQYEIRRAESTRAARYDRLPIPRLPYVFTLALWTRIHADTSFAISSTDSSTLCLTTAPPAAHTTNVSSCPLSASTIDSADIAILYLSFGVVSKSNLGTNFAISTVDSSTLCLTTAPPAAHTTNVSSSPPSKSTIDSTDIAILYLPFGVVSMSMSSPSFQYGAATFIYETSLSPIQQQHIILGDITDEIDPLLPLSAPLTCRSSQRLVVHPHQVESQQQTKTLGDYPPIPRRQSSIAECVCQGLSLSLSMYLKI